MGVTQSRYYTQRCDSLRLTSSLPRKRGDSTKRRVHHLNNNNNHTADLWHKTTIKQLQCTWMHQKIKKRDLGMSRKLNRSCQFLLLNEQPAKEWWLVQITYSCRLYATCVQADGTICGWNVGAAKLPEDFFWHLLQKHASKLFVRAMVRLCGQVGCLPSPLHWCRTFGVDGLVNFGI